MSNKGRRRNERLLAVIQSCGWSYDACICAIRAVAKEVGAELPTLNRSYVAHWVAGCRPSGLTPHYLAEAASRRLGRHISRTDLGFGDDVTAVPDTMDPEWVRDPVSELVTVGRSDLERRDFAKATLYSFAALAIPLDRWSEIAGRGRRAQTGGAAVGNADIEAVRDMTATFSRGDERFGGGHARLAIVAYLTSDVAGYLRGTFRTDSDRRAMFSAAAELTYLAGWKTFDCAMSGLAQNYYVKALRLANEAGDGPLAGFILRAMAHQAVDLGHGQACVQLAESALEWSRANATPGATALFTVVKARGHAAGRRGAATLTALRQAEGMLERVDWDAEPVWIHRMGFGEPSLANQTAQALRDLGDMAGAEQQFRRSTATRDGVAHRRIHALTLANLADVQFSRGQIGEACGSWATSLDAMDGIKSARADQAVRNVRRRIGTLGARTPGFAKRLDERAAMMLVPAASV